MILLLALAAGLVVALLRGGQVSHLSALPLRWPAMPLLAFAAQALVVYVIPESRRQGAWSLHAGILILSYLVLLLFVWRNRRIPGMALAGIGLILNLAVMLANGGYMPITPQAMAQIGHGDTAQIEPGTRDLGSKDVALPQEQTHLWFLSDIFVLPRSLPISFAFSPGDVLLAVGVFWVVQHALTDRTTKIVRAPDRPPGPGPISGAIGQVRIAAKRTMPTPASGTPTGQQEFPDEPPPAP